MNEVMNKYEIWKESILIFLDNAYAYGKNPEELLAEVKEVVSETELGDMSYTIEMIVDEWKIDRGIA